MRTRRRLGDAALVLTAAALLALGGCGYSEVPVDVGPADVTVVPAAADAHRPARVWLVNAQRTLGPLLPEPADAVLLTDAMHDASGHAIDVYKHFGRDPKKLRTIFGNRSGIRATAQGASGGGYNVNRPPPWPGFQEVLLPIGENLQLAGRLGMATRDGQVIDAPCIVLLPGLLGDNAVRRSRDLATGLRACGLHVLSLEQRGLGLTGLLDPAHAYSWGVPSTGDLMYVSDWLTAREHVTATGLIGFCWSANTALLAAWYDGTDDNDPMIPERIRRLTLPRRGGRHYTAGVIAFSPVIGFERVIEELQTPQSMLADPILASMQKTIRGRMEFMRYQPVSGSLRDCIRFDCGRAGYGDPQTIADGLTFLRLLSWPGHPAGNKLAKVRVPALIVHAANDPLGTAQAVADLVSETDNPNVAAVMLAGGGHVGFAPYARGYYMSLIVNFFSPATAPRGQ
ncbi:MAG: hypothetical protein BIFFINMI_01380 [Phycisphaerae bacterium]|nr:hypothetical protein [Phycisphaerae bacterium]